MCSSDLFDFMIFFQFGNFGQVGYCYFQLELIDRSTNLVGLLIVNFDFVVDLAVIVGCFGYSVGFAGCFDQVDRVDCYCCLAVLVVPVS